MVPRSLKAAYYVLLSPLMRLNATRHRLVPSSLRRSRRAHLGPGQKNYIKGWINVDANFLTSRPDVWADLKYKLPFPDGSLDAIYSHHVIEHLPDLDFHFQDMFRCLRPGGVIRVGGPHGDNAMRAMRDGLHDWFGEWPTKRRSLGGRLENFIFCKGEHVTILTESFLHELAQDAGFVDIRTCLPKQSTFGETFDAAVVDLEEARDHELARTLMVEARKPGS